MLLQVLTRLSLVGIEARCSTQLKFLLLALVGSESIQLTVTQMFRVSQSTISGLWNSLLETGDARRRPEPDQISQYGEMIVTCRN